MTAVSFAVISFPLCQEHLSPILSALSPPSNKSGPKPRTNMPFQYEHVLLIGATAGIGAAMADKLIQEGCKVTAVGRRQDRIDAFINKHGGDKASGTRFDISDSKGMDAFVKK